MTYEYYSNVALVASVVVYALAMFAHAAEWAAARRVPLDDHQVAEPATQKTLVAVGAGVTAGSPTEPTGTDSEDGVGAQAVGWDPRLEGE